MCHPMKQNSSMQFATVWKSTDCTESKSRIWKLCFLTYSHISFILRWNLFSYNRGKNRQYFLCLFSIALLYDILIRYIFLSPGIFLPRFVFLHSHHYGICHKDFSLGVMTWIIHIINIWKTLCMRSVNSIGRSVYQVK